MYVSSSPSGSTAGVKISKVVTAPMSRPTLSRWNCVEVVVWNAVGEHAAERVDVGSAVQALAFGALRRRVRGYRPTDAEVGHERFILRRDHHLVRPEIAVHDTRTMG